MCKCGMLEDDGETMGLCNFCHFLVTHSLLLNKCLSLNIDIEMRRLYELHWWRISASDIKIEYIICIFCYKRTHFGFLVLVAESFVHWQLIVIITPKRFE
ncbi:unnamed protein product [Citrullus colocynthis]|uniref:Uncharacterized protein n=1 Tax=Citrullus colocynthis TaxID=252529 RepID=A0ABP0Y3P0_9ROSI